MLYQMLTWICPVDGASRQGEYRSGAWTQVWHGVETGDAYEVTLGPSHPLIWISRTIRSLPAFQDASVGDYAFAASTVYSMLADRGRGGERVAQDALPRCPKCGGPMDNWTGPNPPVPYESDLPPMTHTRWGALNEDAQMDEILGAVSEYLGEEVVLPQRVHSRLGRWKARLGFG